MDAQAKIRFSPLILGLVLILSLSSAVIFLSLKTLKPKEVACTLEAKLCPDGSSVGRIPPTCEFAACPIIKPSSTPTQFLASPTSTQFLNECEMVDASGWKSYCDNVLKASFKYPGSWNLHQGHYINPTKNDIWEVSINDPSYSDENCRGDCPYFGVNFHVKDNKGNSDIISIIQSKYRGMTLKNDYSDLKIEDLTTANGIAFKKVTGFPGGAFYYLYYLRNDTLYTIYPSGGVAGISDDENDPKTRARLDLVDQILSTFQFLDQN